MCCPVQGCSVDPCILLQLCPWPRGWRRHSRQLGGGGGGSRPLDALCGFYFSKPPTLGGIRGPHGGRPGLSTHLEPAPLPTPSLCVQGGWHGLAWQVVQQC